MQTNGICTDNIIMVVSKDALLSENSNFFEENSKKDSLKNTSVAKFCCGVLVYEENEVTFKKMSSSPQNIFKKIKSGKFYLR